MIVISLTACPAGLRGDLTKWLTEISPGTFVGRPSARIRDLLWSRVVTACKDGRAIMVYSSDNEQGMEFKTFHHDWVPTDFDGLTLVTRPIRSGPKEHQRTGWSRARKQWRAQGRG